jgi:hypothetical protein
MESVSEREIRWMLERTADLLEHGAEPVRGLVTPTATFFPDTFDGSAQSVERVVERMKEHAGLGSVPTDLVLVNAGAKPSSGSSCGSGGCSVELPDARKVRRVVPREDGGYTLTLTSSEASHPIAFTTALARGVAGVFVFESGAVEVVPRAELEPTTDLAAALLGFGVLVANGSYIYAKSCGGVKVQQATAMPVEQTTLALALACALFKLPTSTATKHLELTQREHFEEARAFVDSHAPIVKLLLKDPELVRRGAYELGETKSWLARVLGVGKKPKTDLPSEAELASLRSAPAKKKTPLDEARARRLAEARALVYEADEAVGGE